MKKWFLIFVLFSFSLSVFSQTTKDAGVWLSLNVEKKLSKRWEVSLSEEARIKENITQPNLFYTEIGASYKIYGFLKVALAYRWTQKYAYDEGYAFRHRLIMDIAAKKKIGKLTASFRQRVQSQVREVYSSEEGKIPAWNIRERLEVKYDFNKPVEPYVNMELRYQCYDPKDIISNGQWNRIRYSAGIDYKLNRKNTLSFYYLIQHDLNVAEPRSNYIAGLSYTLSL